MSRLYWPAFAGAMSVLLVSCGGGGDSSAPPPPPPPPATPSVSISDASIAEGNSGTSNLSFTVSVANPNTSAVSVNYATADGTATAGSDYTSASASLNIPAGMSSASIDIEIIGDPDFESDETFTVSLSGASNATISTATATGTIQNDDPAPVVGLDSRPDNQSCLAPQRSGTITDVTIEDAFPGMSTIGAPIKIAFEPVSTNPRWFVAARAGQILTVDPASPAIVPYLSLSGIATSGEGGLLGMDFHPDYPATPEIFVSYTRPGGGVMTSVISRIILDDTAAPSPVGAGAVEQVIIEIHQFADNHNGGDIAFGPDGHLYIGLGDGGGGNDPNDTGQDTSNLLGTFLRLDVTGPGVSFPTTPYDIPAGNPFAGQAKCGPTEVNGNNCPEIFAWGFRNPFRWSFDSQTGDLWAGDVGQAAREEIDIVAAGGNYGWDCREGTISHGTSASCGGPFVEPEFDYGRGDGDFSVTGGRVYRGSEISGRIGEYFYADWGSGRIWALRSNGSGGYINEEIYDGPQGPISFAADADGEMYFANINNGRIYRISAGSGGGAPGAVPDLLSDSGCVDPTDITKPYAGLLPYDINAPFWSDGAAKDRYIGLPNGTTMNINAEDDWEFPNGTVIVKNFRLGGSLVETRHLMRHPDGVWAGYTYEWNPGQTEANRVVGGKTVNIGGQDWIFPSEGQCDQCHTAAAGVALGPETAQMNRDFTYPSTGRTDNQLETIDHVMMFTSPLAGTPDTLPALADPSDTSASLDDRARAYLHTNCANCHRPSGGTPVDIDLRYDTALSATGTCNVAPSAGDLGVTGAMIIAPGDAATSTLVLRTGRRDADGMPPLGSNLVDTDGVTLLTDWVNSLTGC